MKFEQQWVTGAYPDKISGGGGGGVNPVPPSLEDADHALGESSHDGLGQLSRGTKVSDEIADSIVITFCSNLRPLKKA